MGKPFRTRVAIKPLSVNRAWQGKRFKTPEYKAYARAVTLMLPAGTLPAPPYKISFEFGMSNVLSDWDNPVKPTQDIICEKYGINDRHIIEAHVRKVKVAKGAEYFICEISSAEV